MPVSSRVARPTNTCHTTTKWAATAATPSGATHSDPGAPPTHQSSACVGGVGGGSGWAEIVGWRGEWLQQLHPTLPFEVPLRETGSTSSREDPLLSPSLSLSPDPESRRGACTTASRVAPLGKARCNDTFVGRGLYSTAWHAAPNSGVTCGREGWGWGTGGRRACWFGFVVGWAECW